MLQLLWARYAFLLAAMLLVTARRRWPCPAVAGLRVCRSHGAHRKKGELPKKSRDLTGTLRRLERKVRRDERYVAMRERREEWRREAATISGFSRISEADQDLIIRLLASDKEEDQRELSKALSYLQLRL